MARIIFLIALLLGGLCFAATENAPSKEEVPKAFSGAPLYSLFLKDATQFKDLVQNNKWAKDFEKTTMFRGMMHSFLPIMNSLARKDEAWTGRLIDYVFEKIMKGRPVEVEYYARQKMNPLVLKLYSVSPTEKKILNTLLQIFKNGENKDYEVYGDNKNIKVGVTPILMYTERLAMVVHNDCVTLGRDPLLVAKTSLHCKPVDTKNDGQMVVNLRELAPTFQGVLENFYTTSDKVSFDLTWKKSESRFAIDTARISIKNTNAFADGALSEDWLKTIPASSQLLVSQFIPEPKTWDIAGITDVLTSAKTDWKGKATVPVTLVYLGMDFNEKSNGWNSLSVLLVPVKKTTENTLHGLTTLFSETNRVEVGFRKVCGDFIAFSPYPSAISRIESACSGKEPSFAQFPPEFVNPIKSGTKSNLIFVNISKYFSAMLDMGSKKESFSQAQFSKEKAVLAQLPTYLFVGKAEKHEVVFRGVSR